jgi:phosphate transport system substrate-binding protein
LFFEKTSGEAMMKKLFCTAVAFAFIPLLVFAKEQITVKGSDTMVILGQRWAEMYMKKNPTIVI